MANPTITYTFVNGNVADASQVNQNFTDLINGLTDGTKSLNIDAITAAGKATFNGAVDLGNATGDAITVNGAFAGTGGDASTTQKGLITTAAQSFAGVKTFTNGISLGNETLAYYDEGTWSPSEISKSNLTGTSSFGTATYTRIGNTVFARIEAITGLTTSSGNTATYIEFSTSGLPGTSNGKFYYGSGYTAVSGGYLTASIVKSGSSNTHAVLLWQAQSSSASQTLSAISFQYTI